MRWCIAKRAAVCSVYTWTGGAIKKSNWRKTMEAREEAERARRAKRLASAMTVDQLIAELQKHSANGHGKAGVMAGCLCNNGEFGFAPLKPGDVLFDGQCVEITSEDDGHG
jgi:hypothetical protein